MTRVMPEREPGRCPQLLRVTTERLERGSWVIATDDTDAIVVFSRQCVLDRGHASRGEDHQFELMNGRQMRSHLSSDYQTREQQ